MQTQFFKIQKRGAEIYNIKTIEIEDFWIRKSKKCPKMIKKHCLDKVFATRFQDVGKPYKTNGKQAFSKFKNASRKTL